MYSNVGTEFVRLQLDEVAPCTPARALLLAWLASYLRELDPTAIPAGHVVIDTGRLAFLPCHRQRLASVDSWHREPLRQRFPGCTALALYEIDRATSSIVLYGFVSLTTGPRVFNPEPFLDASVTLPPPALSAAYPFLTLESAKNHACCDELFRTTRLDPEFEAPLLSAALSHVSELPVRDMLAGRDLLLKKYKREFLCSPTGIVELGKLNYYLRLALLCIAYTGDAGEMHAPALQMGCSALAALVGGLVSILHPTEDSVANVISSLGLPLQVVGLDPMEDFTLCSARDTCGPYYVPYGHAPSIAKVAQAYKNASGNIAAHHQNWAASANTAGMFPTPEGISFVKLDTTAKKFKRTAPLAPIAVLYEKWPVSFYCHVQLPEWDEKTANRILRSLLHYLCFRGADLNGEARIDWACQPLQPTYHGWALFYVQNIIFLGGKPELDAFISDWRAHSCFEIKIRTDVGSSIDSPSAGTDFVAHIHPSTLAMPKPGTLGLSIHDIILSHVNNPDFVEPLPLVQAISAARTLAQKLAQPAPSYLLHDPATGKYLSPHSLGQWVGERTVSDVMTTRAMVWRDYRGDKKNFFKKHYLGGALAYLYKPLNTLLTEPLLRQLTSAIAEKARAAEARATPSLPARPGKPSGGGQPFSGRSQRLFDAEPFRTAEAKVANDQNRVQSYLMYLTGATRVGSASRGTGLEATSETHKITYTLANAPKYATSWKDWKDLSGAGKGWKLGSLTKYVKGFATDREAVQFFLEWSLGNVSAPSSLPAHPVSPEMSFGDRQTAAEYIIEHKNLAKRSSRVIAGTVANDYLRKIRGLGRAEEGGAPRSLVEENPFMVAQRSARPGPNDDRRPCLTVFTSTYQARQNIFLDEATSNKDMTLEQAKKSGGRLNLPDGDKDNVPLQIVPETARYLVVAEGPETGLSVACALRRANVCALLGVGNIEELRRVPGIEIVVWCRENDRKKTTEKQALADSNMARYLKALSGRFAQVHCVFPPAEFNDFNDVHRKHEGAAGTRIIDECFRTQLPAEIYEALK